MIANIYRGFILDKNCQLMFPPGFCRPISHVLEAGSCGMVYIQTGLLIERSMATFVPHYSEKLSYHSGIMIGLLVIVCSVVAYQIVTWNELYDTYVFSCILYPAKSANRANNHLFTLVILSLMNLISTVILMSYNKSIEFRARFNVQGRFESRECIDSTITICFISLIQFICMFVYCFGILTLRLMIDKLPYLTYGMISTWLYTVPLSALCLPITLIYRIYKNRRIRFAAIHNITKQHETQEEHMAKMRKLWS